MSKRLNGLSCSFWNSGYSWPIVNFIARFLCDSRVVVFVIVCSHYFFISSFCRLSASSRLSSRVPVERVCHQRVDGRADSSSLQERRRFAHKCAVVPSWNTDRYTELMRQTGASVDDWNVTRRTVVCRAWGEADSRIRLSRSLLSIQAPKWTHRKKEN